MSHRLDREAVYAECLSPACLIYNADENAFGMDPAGVRGRKGEVLHMVTVLACVSASGQTLPPMAVYTGKAVQPRWLAQTPLHGIMYAATG